MIKSNLIATIAVLGLAVTRTMASARAERDAEETPGIAPFQSSLFRGLNMSQVPRPG
jgi:hypothetical protein